MVGFTGGERLQAYLSKIAASVSNPGTLRVGFLEGATEDDGTSVALVAAMNEFGAPSRGQPPRPFIRRMLAKESGHWVEDIAALLKAHGMDATAALNGMGSEIAGEMLDSLDALIDPPLAASTIAKKGFAKPLLDTGTMRKALEEGSHPWEIVK